MRVRGDENAVPSFHANKAIHQRNKSTPALSLVAQNTMDGNGNARRVFGDVSNAKQIRDDSGLPGKPAIVDTKPALAQPAQRPLSTSGVKGLLNHITSKPVNPAGKARHNTHKNNAKRVTGVFRDQLEPVVEKEPSKEVIVTTQPARRDERSDGIETVRSHAKKSHEDEDEEYFDLASEEFATEVKPGESEEERVQAPAAPNEGKLRALPKLPLSLPYDEISGYTTQDVAGPVLSEPDESEDEDTRGYPFRTDNTTGGTTTVIYPRATAAMRREILQAQTFVEANQTEEEIEEDFYDSSMVAEYSTEIFQYLRSKEASFCFYQLDPSCDTDRLSDLDVTHAGLHGQPVRDSVVHARSPHGLASAGSLPLRPAPRDSISLRQPHRSLPLIQDCLTWQAPAGWGYCHLHCRQV